MNCSALRTMSARVRGSVATAARGTAPRRHLGAEADLGPVRELHRPSGDDDAPARRRGAELPGADPARVTAAVEGRRLVRHRDVRPAAAALEHAHRLAVEDLRRHVADERDPLRVRDGGRRPHVRVERQVSRVRRLPHVRDGHADDGRLRRRGGEHEGGGKRSQHRAQCSPDEGRAPSTASPPADQSTMKTAAAGLVVSLAIVLCATAAAATPTAYRAQVNAICRAYTPAFHRLQAQMKHGDEDEGRPRVRARPRSGARPRAPAGPARRGRPGTGGTEAAGDADPHAHAEDRHRGPPRARPRDRRRYERHGDAAEGVSQQTKPLNAMLDAAGLRDCGSNQ